MTCSVIAVVRLAFESGLFTSPSKRHYQSHPRDTEEVFTLHHLPADMELGNLVHNQENCTSNILDRGHAEYGT